MSGNRSVTVTAPLGKRRPPEVRVGQDEVLQAEGSIGTQYVSCRFSAHPVLFPFDTEKRI